MMAGGPAATEFSDDLRRNSENAQAQQETAWLGGHIAQRG
jgi:hypothetical protein